MAVSPWRSRIGIAVAAALLAAVPAAAAAVPAGAAGAAAVPAGAAATGGGPTTVLYDSFSKRGGYTLADYAAKWTTPYGLGEMAVSDTRRFAHGRFSLAAAPFRTAYDVSVFDHIKYLATSTQAFGVPERGSIEIAATIRAATPGTQRGRVVRGTYVASGAPYAAPTLEGQQAGVVMNVIDFATGQLFDWFVTGDTAFALIERLPSTVTGNTTDPASPDYVGRTQMYTQIIREVRVRPGVPHRVSIRFSRGPTGSAVDYHLDGVRVAHVDRVGVPLDVQGRPYTGNYPSLGPGEDLTTQLDSVVIGHGLFSLLDAFPFQHPEAPELAVSIPVGERIFGQGAVGSFDDFTVRTTPAG